MSQPTAVRRSTSCTSGPDYTEERGSPRGYASLTHGGSVADTTPFPAYGCCDTATRGLGLSDAQLRAEIDWVVHAETVGRVVPLGAVDVIFTKYWLSSCYE